MSNAFLDFLSFLSLSLSNCNCCTQVRSAERVSEAPVCERGRVGVAILNAALFRLRGFKKIEKKEETIFANPPISDQKRFSSDLRRFYYSLTSKWCLSVYSIQGGLLKSSSKMN